MITSRAGVTVSLLVGLAACGGDDVPVGPDAGGDPCTSADPGCTWDFGTPHWLPPLVELVPVPSQPRVVRMTPRWISPDGLRLYTIYVADQGFIAPGVPRVVVMGRDSVDAPFTTARDGFTAGIEHEAVSDITFSQDETEKFFTTCQPARFCSGTGKLYWSGRRGREEISAQLGDWPANPFLSADGKELFYTAGTGSKLRRVARAAPGEAFGPAEDVAGIDLSVRSVYLTNDGQVLFITAYVGPNLPDELYRSERVGPAAFTVPVRVDVGVPTSEVVLSEATGEAFFGSASDWSPYGVSVWRARVCRGRDCPEPKVECPSGQRSPDGLHCYTKLAEPRSHADAAAACAAMGGTLATIQGPAEQSAVWQQAGGVAVWVGGFDDRDNVAECGGRLTCRWGWDTGERWTYHAWTQGQPDEAGAAPGQDCLVLDPAQDGKWVDESCAATVLHAAVCETTLYPI